MRAGLLILVGVAGAIVGAALHYSIARPEPGRSALSIRADAAAAALAARAQPQQTSGSVTAERAALYRAAAAAHRDELDAMVRDAAAKPQGAERTFALNLLLLRYAELDPQRAIDVAAGLSAELRAPLFAVWAKTDPASALAALAAVKDRAAARVIAAALVPALGGDDRALREVAAAVPFGVESAVYADALIIRAAEAPASAFRQAIDLTDMAARSQALEGIAAVWARLDPRAALTALDDVYDPSLRRAFLMGVTATWARLDPDATLAYLKSLDSSARPDLVSALGTQLAEARPRELLEVAAANTPMSQILRLQAIRGLANQDPSLALREAEALPAGTQREGAIGEIARTYGARDPDAALAWARASGDNSRTTGVLQGIAQRDAIRAFDLAVAIESPQQRLQAVLSIMATAAIPSGANPATLADRALALTDAGLRASVLRQVLGRWSSTAPDAAFDWVLAHDVSPQDSFLQVAQQLARSNPARAAEYTTRVPASSRTEWIQGVASGYAQADPQAAAQWIEQYRGDRGYSAAAVAVAVGLARIDPAAAARLLATAKDSDVGMQGAFAVAQQWARRDPHAAAAWAAEYDASLGRIVASPSVVAAWAQSDAPAARAWTLRMPAGPNRDSVLSSLLSSYPADAIDKGLLEGFSDANTRNDAVVNTAMRLGNTDRVAATRLLDAYVSDEGLRARARRNLDRPGMGFSYDSTGSTSAIFFSPR